jgi:hypothetical protein
MVAGTLWVPVDCDSAGSAGNTPRPLPPMLTQTTEGFQGSIKSLVVPELRRTQFTAFVDVKIFPALATATKSPLPNAKSFMVSVMPVVCFVQTTPSGEVTTVPDVPTATNVLFAYVMVFIPKEDVCTHV